MPSLKQAESAIVALEAEKRDADRAAVEANRAFHASNADPLDPETPEFKAFDEASKKADVLGERLTSAREMYARLRGTSPASPGGEQAASGDGPRDENWLDRVVETQKAMSVGRRIVGSDAFKSLLGVVHDDKFGSREIGEAYDRDTQKALIGTAVPGVGGEHLVTPDRQPLVNLVPQRPLRIIDLVTKATTDSKSIEYPVLVSRGMAAGYVADPVTNAPIGSGDPAVTPVQAGLKPETALAFDIRTFRVKTLATWIAVHKNMMEDVAFIESLIDQLLRDELDQRIETDIVTGTGANESLKGILNTDGIGSVTVGTGGILDAAHKAMTQVRLSYEEPNAYGIHPLTWESIRLLRDDSGATAGTGPYMFGPPSQAGDSTLWGKPVVVTTAIPQGTVLTGDFSKAVFWLRTGTTVKASDSHADYFTRNLVAILAELRAAFGVVKPLAFAKAS